MSYGRSNMKIKPTGFNTAATELTWKYKISPEAAHGLTLAVKDVAHQFHYNDSAALNSLRARLRQAAKNQRKGDWAREVLSARERAIRLKRGSVQAFS